MKAYKLLVIDDAISTREDAYKEVLHDRGLFDVEFVRRSAQLRDMIASTNASAYVIDVRLDNWGIRLEDVLQMIGDGRPVILVSNYWREITEHERTLAIRTAANSPFMDVFAWSQFYDEQGQMVNPDVADNTVWKIRKALDAYYQRSSLSLGDSDTVNIIHISDTQFGDLNADGAAFLLHCAVGNFLRKKGIEPHFLIATGDIAFSGKPNEYTTAMNWFSDLAHELWPGREREMKERILIVPGNHDVNFRLCAADDYDYNPKTRKLVPLRGPAPDTSHRRYGLAPFMTFAYGLTGDSRWLSYDNQLSWVSDQFLNLGIRFYLINSVAETSAHSPDRCVVPAVAMEAMINQSRNYPERGLPVFNIVISHHGRSSAPLKGFENWDEIKNFLEVSNADMLIHGHGHQWQGKEIQEGTSIYHTLQVMAPSTHVSGKKRPPDERRGFNLIHLKRRDGIVKTIQAQPYEVTGVEIVPRKTARKSWKAPLRQFQASGPTTEVSRSTKRK